MFIKGTNCMRKHSELLIYCLQIDDRVRTLSEFGCTIHLLEATCSKWAVPYRQNSQLRHYPVWLYSFSFACPTNSQGMIISKTIKSEDTDFQRQSQCYFPSKHSFPNLKEPLRSPCSAANKVSILLLSPIFFLTSKIKFLLCVH